MIASDKKVKKNVEIYGLPQTTAPQTLILL